MNGKVVWRTGGKRWMRWRDGPFEGLWWNGWLSGGLLL